MIPRLWTCTSHPVLSVSSLPLSVGFILALCLASGRLKRFRDPILALRLRYLAGALSLCFVVGTTAIALAGGVVVLLGAHANSIFVAARYLWPVLSVVGVIGGHFFGSRALVRAIAAERLPVRTSAVHLGTWLAGAAFALYIPHLFVSREPHLWALPYQGAELAFDLMTTPLASDECLAFRTVDDVQLAFGSPPPGEAAFFALHRYGADAVPGISDFLKDEAARGWPSSAATVGLLARVARHGDFPILRLYEQGRVYYADLMRKCIHDGGTVIPTSRYNYRCERGR